MELWMLNNLKVQKPFRMVIKRVIRLVLTLRVGRWSTRMKETLRGHKNVLQIASNVTIRATLLVSVRKMMMITRIEEVTGEMILQSNRAD